MDDREAYIGNKCYGVIVDFLRGRRTDWQGRWLADIRTWDPDQLEEDHQYIQWLFPLTTESESAFAPVLRAYEVLELRADCELHGVLIASLEQMLSFYGFQLRNVGDALSVVQSPHFETQSSVWMTPQNHNYRRVSRILRSLVLVGLEAYARAFLARLEQLYQSTEGRASIDWVAMWYWRHHASTVND